MPTALSRSWGRLWSRLTVSVDEREADALARLREQAGATAIAQTRPGTEYLLAGVLASVTFQPVGAAHGLNAELFDGTGRVRLVWLGRGRVPGIEPGRAMSVRGRVVRTGGHVLPTVFNPRYTLLAAGPA